MEIPKIKFSIIVPCYNTNPAWTERMLDSFTRQGVDSDQIEVILVDDRSTETDWIDTASKYDLNISIVSTDEDTDHTPGNTRNKGLEYITGDWLCFCDHDDMFEDDTLLKVQEHIHKHNSPYGICCNMRSWNEKEDKYVDFVHKQAWLHGKFYNVKHLIQPYNIRFLKGMHTHEDIAFNCSCQAVMYELNTDFEYVDIMAYRWIEEPTSITRGFPDRGYLHEYFLDYTRAASEPFFKGAKTGNWWFVNQILMCLLHLYFYYMGAIYREGVERYEDNLEVIKDFYDKIAKELNLTSVDIIYFVADDAKKYQVVRNDCIMHEGCFMEAISFPDFVQWLEKETGNCVEKEER